MSEGEGGRDGGGWAVMAREGTVMVGEGAGTWLYFGIDARRKGKDGTQKNIKNILKRC